MDFPQPQHQPFEFHIKITNRLVPATAAALEEVHHHVGHLSDLHLHEAGLDPFKEVADAVL